MQIPAAQSASQDLSEKHRKRCKNQRFQQRHQETSTISLDGSATVTQKSFRNVGKTSKTSIPGVNGWGGSLRGSNDGMVIQTDADAENHWKSLGKQRFHNAAYTFRNNCLLWRQCSSADGNGYQRTSRKRWENKQNLQNQMSCKSGVGAVHGRPELLRKQPPIAARLLIRHLLTWMHSLTSSTCQFVTYPPVNLQDNYLLK